MATTRAKALESFKAFVGHFRIACDLIVLQFFSNETLLVQREFFFTTKTVAGGIYVQQMPYVLISWYVIHCPSEYCTVQSTNQELVHICTPKVASSNKILFESFSALKFFHFVRQCFGSVERALLKLALFIVFSVIKTQRCTL